MSAERNVIAAGRRFTARRRRRRWVPAVAAALLVTLAGAGYVLLTSSAFALRTLVIRLDLSATSRLSRGDVARAATPPFGRPLIDLPLETIRRRVASLPSVAEVSVSRSWPHTLVLDVVGRRAVARLAAGSATFLVDASGVVFATAGPVATGAGAAAGLPVVRMPGYALHVTARRQPAAAAAVRALASLPPAVREDARRLHMAADGLRFADRHVSVVWGGAAGAEDKAAELATILARRPAARPSWVDLSTPGLVVTRRPRQNRHRP